MMRRRAFVLFAVALPLTVATTVHAQTTSELSGRVIYEDRSMPGVTVTVRSPSLQGQRTTITNALGDYVIKFLPAGDYTVRFELDTYAILEYGLKVSTAQSMYLDAVMYPEAMQEEIVVEGQYEALSTGAQGSQTIELKTLEKLALPRTIEAAVLLSAGTAAYGGQNRISISGAPTDSSLYTMNGVVINHNNTGQPAEMFIEDAILETTTMTNSMSAEYGRFSGGVVNMVTKSGGNEFSGSLRTSFTNDAWNGATPLTTDQVDEINTIWEATFGGYLWRDRLWFFLAGRNQSLSESNQVVTPGQPDAAIPFTTGDDERRLEAKLTGSINPSHRILLSYIDTETTLTNKPFLPPADFDSIDPWETRPQVGWSLSYTGVLSDSFFIEGLYSERDFAFQDGGGEDTRLGATPVWDWTNWVTFHAPTFWAEAESTRANSNVYAKGSLFFSGAGTHDLVFGVDVFEDNVAQNNYQSATGYAWMPFSPQDYSEPGNPYTHIDPYGGFIVWGDVLEETEGNSLMTKSAFVNDTWRVSDRVTLNLGLRYDKNDGANCAGVRVVYDYRLSPRLSASWDVRGDGRIIVTGGASQYVKEIGQAGEDGAAGSPAYGLYLYAGPAIYAGTPEYPTNFEAISAMFDWFFNVYGGPTNTSMVQDLFIPGLVKVSEDLSSPYANELTVGASFRLGTRGVLRLDYIHRTFHNHYTTEVVPNRWAESEEFGIVVDLPVTVNENDVLNRRYDGLLARFDYRIGSRWSFGANYTGYELHGYGGGAGLWSDVGEDSVLSYQEYKDPSWNSPPMSNRRLTLRAWAIWDAISTNHHNFSLSLLQNFWTGDEYTAWGFIDTVPYVGAPADLGYVGQPGWVIYHFETGENHTENITRTDLALNYSFFVNIGGSQLEFFIQPEVINVFNEQGAVTVESSVLTAYTPGTGLEPFDPWTTEPVEGMHWVKHPNFGQPGLESDYQTPRTFRFSVGLRF